MGLDMAKGVGTPMALILCCMVGLGGRPGLRPTGCWLSGERGSGVWLRDMLEDNLYNENVASTTEKSYFEGYGFAVKNCFMAMSKETT